MIQWPIAPTRQPVIATDDKVRMPEENLMANKSKENIPKSPIKMIEQLAKINIRPKVISTFCVK